MIAPDRGESFLSGLLRSSHPSIICTSWVGIHHRENKCIATIGPPGLQGGGCIPTGKGKKSTVTPTQELGSLIERVDNHIKKGDYLEAINLCQE